MKILIVHNHYRLRGGEDVCFEADTQMLRDRGNEVWHFTRHNDDVGSQGKLKEARQTLWNRRTYDEATELMRKVRPEVVHVHNTFPLISPSIYDAAHDLGIPVVQSLHNFRPLCVGAALCRDGKFCTKCLDQRNPWSGVRYRCYRGSLAASAVAALLSQRNQSRHLWQRIDRYITFCQAARELYSQSGFPAERIDINPHFVEQEHAMLESTDRAFIFVGRLTPEKGLDRLLNAWKRYEGDWELRLVGEGEMEEQCRSAAKADTRIRFLGKIPRAEMLQWMASSSCLVFPSPAFETFGRVLIEAFSLGVPVIASWLGGPIDIVNSNRLGVLVEPTDENAITAALVSANDWLGDFAERRQACRERYLATYTIESNYQRLMHSYQLAIESRAGRATREVLT